MARKDIIMGNYMMSKKEKIFNIIQIGDKSNRISRLFDFFITVIIIANISVTFLLTFQQLAFLFPFFRVVEVVTLLFYLLSPALHLEK